jgi:hypothetical protein
VLHKAHVERFSGRAFFGENRHGGLDYEPVAFVEGDEEIGVETVETPLRLGRVVKAYYRWGRSALKSPTECLQAIGEARERPGSTSFLGGDRVPS